MPTGSNQTIDFAQGNMQLLDLSSASGDVTATFSNAVAGGSYAIQITQGTNARAVVWPTTVKWPGGMPMTLSTIPGSVDLITFFFNGTNFLAVGGLNFNIIRGNDDR